MSEVYSVFTVESGKVTVGAVIGTLHLQGAGIDIPAIIVGEEGRGRQRGVVPVGNPPMVPCPEGTKNVWNSSGECAKCGTRLEEKEGIGATHYHPDQGQVMDRLLFAEVGQTRAGKPKFFSKRKATTDEHIIVVFRTPIGYRGGNDHTGDRAGWKCCRYGCDAAGGEGTTNVPEVCPQCGADRRWGGGPRLNFAEFPGRVITRGRIAQGAAGRAGSGEQLVALMPKDVVFRTAYSGRLYGEPSAHYYQWDGAKLLAATWNERAVTDLF